LRARLLVRGQRLSPLLLAQALLRTPIYEAAYAAGAEAKPDWLERLDGQPLTLRAVAQAAYTAGYRAVLHGYCRADMLHAITALIRDTPDADWSAALRPMDAPIHSVAQEPS
jgi:hypothetical protein